MKACTRCGQTKSELEFSLRAKDADKRRSICIKCMGTYFRAFYERNRSAYNCAQVLYRTKYRRRNRALVLAVLEEHPCVDCGENDLTVLEFDHVRGRKIDEISALVAKGARIELLRRELEKCDVRCANCHRRRTSRERGYYRAKVKQLEAV
jgi:hypothetical protein